MILRSKYFLFVGVLLAGLVFCLLSSCNADRWHIRPASRSALDSTARQSLDSLLRPARILNTLWHSSPRRTPMPQVEIRWAHDDVSALRPTRGAGEEVKEIYWQVDLDAGKWWGEAQQWLNLKPFLLNRGDRTLRVNHFRQLPIPQCIAFFEGRKIFPPPYYIQSIGTSSTIQPDKPFRYRSGWCEIPLLGKGVYWIVAHAELSYPASEEEREIVNRAFETRPKQDAKELGRRLHQTERLTVVSEPLIIKVE